MDFTIINFDEATFRLVPIKQRIWALKGSKPSLPFWFSNSKANIFGALIDGQKLFYKWFDKLDTKMFIQFIKDLIEYLPKDKKYLFIFDNAPAHKSKESLEFLKNLDKNFAIEFLPPYSPQLNCIESCWKTMRYEVTSANLFKSIEDLKLGIEGFLKNHFFTFKTTNYLTR